MKRLPLKHGAGVNKHTLVDNDDFKDVSKYQWTYHLGYAIRFENQKHIFLHRVIAKTPKGLITDHINGDKLDNRKCNLRVCSFSQNQQNRQKHKITSSRYKGVQKGYKDKWIAYLQLNKVHIHLGTFRTEIEAALAYNQKAQEYFKEFARLNVI